MSESEYRGRLIVIEGVDGTGKTTVTDYLQDVLTIRGKHTTKVKRLAVPNKDSKVGSAVRKLFSLYGNRLSHATQVELMDLAFQQAGECIHEYLKEDCVVLCDRWIPSFMVYQHQNDHFSPLTRATIGSRYYRKIPVDLTIYLDADIQTISERLARRNETDAMENLDMIQKAQKLYKTLEKEMGERWNWHTVDSSTRFMETRTHLESILIAKDFIWSRQ